MLLERVIAFFSAAGSALAIVGHCHSSGRNASDEVGSWRPWLVPVILTFITPAQAGWEENECVKCHESDPLPIALGHSFEEWSGSVHARAGVGCEKCHGGDASAPDAANAHRGVLPASEPASLVHRSQLGTTCGSCHAEEHKVYANTPHARQVAEHEGAVTCFTCHGSMATSLPSPALLRSRCAICHDKPVQAQTALRMLAGTKIQLHRTRRALEKTQAEAADTEWYDSALPRLQELERRFRDISLEWHTLAMEAVLNDSRNLFKLASLLDEEIDVRMKMERHQN